MGIFLQLPVQILAFYDSGTITTCNHIKCTFSRRNGHLWQHLFLLL